MQVHLETLKEVEPYVYTRKGETRSVPQFTIEVTISNGRKEDRRAVSCRPHDGDICIHGLAVRFSSGSKIWPGTAWYIGKTKMVGNVRPNIDRMGHFILVGFIEDYDGKGSRSNHNAVD